MARRLLEIAASIVKAQASVAKVSSEEIQRTLMNTFLVLQKMQQAEQEDILLEGAAEKELSDRAAKQPESFDPKESIRESRVMCLECGLEMKQLTRKHLGTHGLTSRDYKKKYGFTMRQSLSAKSLSRARSRAAKKRGLPENLVKFQEERRRKKVAARSAPAKS